MPHNISNAEREEVQSRTYRQHNTKSGYEFFIDTIGYVYGKCAGRVWIDKGKKLSKQCSRTPHFGALFCKQHEKIENQNEYRDNAEENSSK